MRVLAARSVRCPVCVALWPRGTRWCGACGATLVEDDLVVLDRTEALQRSIRVATARSRHLPGSPAVPPLPVRPVADPVVEPAPDDSDGVEVPASPRWRDSRVAGALLAGLLVTVVVATGDRGGVGDSDVGGRLDLDTGHSSTVAAFTELQLLWARPLEGAVEPRGADGPVAIGDDHVLIGDDVVHLATGAVRTSGVGKPGPDGTSALVEAGALVRLDPVTGAVLGRAPIEPSTVDGWRPQGAAVGWAAGMPVFSDADGRLGALRWAEGTAGVAWVLDGGQRWEQPGVAARYLVVTQSDQWGVVDAETGAWTFTTDGSGAFLAAGSPAPVVVDGVVAAIEWRLQPGGATPVLVVLGAADGAVRFERSLSEHPAMVLGAGPLSMSLVAGDERIVVLGPAAGGAVAAYGYHVADGSLADFATVRIGPAVDGWPLHGFTGAAHVHIDPVQARVRAVDLGGLIRWAVPVEAGHALAVGERYALLRTPSVPGFLDERYRLLDIASGEELLDLTDASGTRMQVVGLVDGHAVVRAAASDGSVTRDAWYDMTTGRLTVSTTGLQPHLDEGLDAVRLLGTVAGVPASPLVLARDGEQLVLAGPWDRPVPLPADELALSRLHLDTVVVGDVVALPLRADGGTVLVRTSSPTGEDVRLPTVHALAASGDRLVGRVAPAGALAAFSVDGTSLWRGPVIASDATVLANRDVVAVVERARVVVLAAATGEVLVEQVLVVAATPDEAVLHTAHVAWLGVDGTLRALPLDAATDGWTTQIEGGGVTLTGAGPTTVVGTRDGDLVVVGADGAVRERVDVGRDEVEDLMVSEGRVVATVGAGLVGYGRGAWFVEAPDRVELP